MVSEEEVEIEVKMVDEKEKVMEIMMTLGINFKFDNQF